MTFNIGPLKVGPSEPCAVIAELSNNHGGDFDRCIRLIDAAKAAGASAVKLQAFEVGELLALRGDGPAPAPWNDRSMSDLYSQAITPRRWFKQLYDHAAAIDLPIFSSVFGLDSLALLESLGNPCYKIARLDNQHTELIAAVGATGKPLIISEDNGLRVRDHAADGAVWLYCPSGYPQTKFAFHHEMWHGSAGAGQCEWDAADYLGFSYHGTDPLPCIAAVALGAKIIEAHFQLDAEPSVLEANVSLGQTAFASMVADIRRVESMLA